MTGHALVTRIDSDGTESIPTGWSGAAFAVGGGLIGGLVGALFAAGVTEGIKRTLAVVSRQDDWVLLVAPLAGIAVAWATLHYLGHGEAEQHLDDAPAAPRVRLHPWRSFPLDLARADLTADVVATAGREERFPWRLAPLRAIAILITVGSGAPMGTEAPAAHLGVAAGAALGSPPRARRPARWMGLGGGAAAVAALMGLPLVGLAFILELGRRRRVPITVARVLAAGSGALVGWLINVVFDLDLIRLAVPALPPDGVLAAMTTTLLVGAISGALAALTGVAIYQVRGWESSPVVKLLLGGLSLAATIIILLAVAGPAAAVGPGAGAVSWADTAGASGVTMLLVAGLRALATTAAVAAGGVGGVFVPFLAIGDVSGRALAPMLGVPPDLAGAAGAAGGISGGYRLPVTAVAMVIGVGGPFGATLTCLATVVVAAGAGLAVAVVIERLTKLRGTASRIVDDG